MLNKTITRTRTIFGGLIILALFISIFYLYNQPDFVSTDRKFISEVSYFQTHGNKNAVMVVYWKTLLNKDTAANKDNFTIEQVKPDGRNWVPVSNGKKCKIGFIQYVYAPWVDTEAKRNKAEPGKKDNKITQIFVSIEPKEEINDYYRITVKNVESTTGEKIENQEYGIVKITGFNNLIKM